MKNIGRPEERWEDQQLWAEEKRREQEAELSQSEIDDIKADEAYDDR